MKKIVLPFFLILLFSCGEKVVEKPENLIPKEKMALVLHDLAILNTIESSFSSTLKKYDIEVMEFLYNKHKIDSVQFSQSDLYYASIPLEYQSIYEQVEAILETRRKAIEEESKKRKDSISDSRKKKNDSTKKSNLTKKEVPNA